MAWCSSVPRALSRNSPSVRSARARSIRQTPNGVNFVVTAGAARLQVENTGSPPQLFQVNIPVIAVGHFSGTAFVSNQILVKHSSNYIAQHPGRVTSPNGTKR